MKRETTVLLTTISLVFLITSLALAQVKVDEPVLPQGFESWQYKLSHSCQSLEEVVWARIDKDKNTFEYIILTEFDGRDFSITHIGGHVYTHDFSNTYALLDGGWLKFNNMDREEKERFFKLEEDEFTKNGLNPKNYAANCIKFDKEFFDFIEKILSEANK